LQGEWINLYEKTYGVGGIEGFAYCYTLPTGEEIIYCTTEDMQNCTTNFYDIMAERRAEEERLAAEQAAAEQAAAEQAASDYWKDDSQDPNISDYPVTSAHDMNHGDDWRTGGNPY
jgi:hypothetical protein